MPPLPEPVLQHASQAGPWTIEAEIRLRRHQGPQTARQNVKEANQAQKMKEKEQFFPADQPIVSVSDRSHFLPRSRRPAAAQIVAMMLATVVRSFIIKRLRMRKSLSARRLLCT